jgi:FdhD protein
MTDQQKFSPALVQEFDVINIIPESIQATSASVCIEDRVTLFVNGNRVASLAISPEDLEAYAYGYLICEGIVKDINSVRNVRIDFPDIYVEVSSSTPEIRPDQTEIRSSGCIGVRTTWTSLSEPLGGGITIDLPTLFEGIGKINEYAPVWKSTGGTHCTIILDDHGIVKSAVEDMGRHNSVDKAVGKALLDGIDLSRCFMVCTGRMPAGMVAKAYRAGISIVASNTAPFSAGIQLARKVNVTLACFVRPPRAMIYSAPERIRLPWFAE